MQANHLTILADLAQRLGVDDELCTELMMLFLDHGESDCRNLRAALSTQDSTLAADSAHSIKGAALALRLDPVAAVACQAETLARNGEVLATEPLITQLEEMLTAFRVAMKKE